MLLAPLDYSGKAEQVGAAYSGAMDLTLSILPWKIIWNLRMTRREKTGVLLAMSMGVL